MRGLGTVTIIMSVKRTISDFFTPTTKRHTSEQSDDSASSSKADSDIDILSQYYESEWCSDESDSENESEDESRNNQSLKASEIGSTSSIKIPNITNRAPVKGPEGPSDLSQLKNECPRQPNLKIYPTTKFGNKMRNFNNKWYSIFPWLEYSIMADAVYCFPCRHFSHKIDYGESTFISCGFKNWKRALEKEAGLRKHGNSTDHKNNEVKWVSYKSLCNKVDSGSVATLMNTAHLNLVKENRTYIAIIIDALLFTATQCIAQRGNKEDVDSLNRGNFLELLYLIAEHNELVRKKINEELPKNAKYTSPLIQNEILSIFAKLIRHQISAEVRDAKYFAVICDETKDISKTEQLSIVLRYCYDGVIYERFIGFRAAENLDAQSLFLYIKESLACCEIDLKNCVAQTYDGANVMSGRLNGVQKLFRDEVEEAVYVHCFNHRLNLIVMDVCKNLPTGQFFDTLETLYVFVSGSAIHSKFISLQKRLSPSTKPTELKRICYTRWTAQVFACISIKKVFSILLLFLNTLANEQSSKYPEAAGLLDLLDFKFIFCLCFFHNILTLFKGASDFLQKVTSDMSAANSLIKSIHVTVQNMRNDLKCFENIYKEAEQICVENNIHIESEKLQRRNKKIPKKFEAFYFTENVRHLESESILERSDFRVKIFVPALDRILSELSNRFGNHSEILSGIDVLHPKNENFLNLEQVQTLASHYKIDIDLMQAEFKILKNAIPNHEKENNIQVENILQFLDFLKKYKLVFPETFKIVSISVTVPVSSAGCERTFSCLRRLKNYMRNKMSQERLSDLAIINIEREIVKSLNKDLIIDYFDAAHNNRRIILH